MRQGKSQCFFVDGNNGVNRHKEYYQKNKEKMKFLQKTIEISIDKTSMQNEKKFVTKIVLKRSCSIVKTLLKLAKQGPDCVSVICNRCFYPKTVTEFKCEKYNLDVTNVIHPAAVNSTDYISKVCHNNFKKSRIPLQEVYNEYHIFLD